MSFKHSIVKISDEVPRDDPATIRTVVWTDELTDVFKLNTQEDKHIRSVVAAAILEQIAEILFIGFSCFLQSFVLHESSSAIFTD